jgi:hypothetical protein
MAERDAGNDRERTAWEQHNLSQLRYFRSLSLRGKMQAIENLCRIAQRFKQMRESGAFQCTSGHATEPPLKRDET